MASLGNVFLIGLAINHGTIPRIPNSNRLATDSHLYSHSRILYSCCNCWIRIFNQLEDLVHKFAIKLKPWIFYCSSSLSGEIHRRFRSKSLRIAHSLEWSKNVGWCSFRTSSAPRRSKITRISLKFSIQISPRGVYHQG